MANKFTNERLDDLREAHRLRQAVFGKRRLRKDFPAKREKSAQLAAAIVCLCKEDGNFEDERGTFIRRLLRANGKQLKLEITVDDMDGQEDQKPEIAEPAIINFKEKNRLLNPKGYEAGIYAIRETIFIDEKRQAQVERTIRQRHMFYEGFEVTGFRAATEAEVDNALDTLTAAVREDDSWHKPNGSITGVDPANVIRVLPLDPLSKFI